MLGDGHVGDSLIVFWLHIPETVHAKKVKNPPPQKKHVIKQHEQNNSWEMLGSYIQFFICPIHSVLTLDTNHS